MTLALSLIASALVSFFASTATLHMKDNPVQLPDLSPIVQRLTNVEEETALHDTELARLRIAVDNAQTLGATNAIPTVVALFETSLANAITSSQTTMTLVSALDKTGTALASSTYAFIIDEGTASEEMVIADCTGTACTNMTRGISPITGTTTVTALQKAHRRGASVKITDGPQLMILSRILNGYGTIPNIISYTSHPTFVDNTQLVDKKYVDDTAFSGAGVIESTTLALGVSELATGCEAASSTPSGGGGVLVIPASLATSTYNSATAPCKVIVAGNTGKIDNNFIATSTLFSSSSFTTGTTTINGSLTLSGGNSSSNIASTSIITFTASTSPTTNWSKPANLRYIIVEVVGGGGTGGTAGAGGGCAGEASGGGGGGYAREIIPASALAATEPVAVGGGGSWGSGKGGTSSFGSFLSATGGLGGSASSGSAATGGTGTGGDINMSGQGGNPGADAGAGGNGGSSQLGGGGAGGWCTTGAAGGSYGAGGGGGGTTSGGSSSSGGTGATGAVIVHQFFF